MHAGSRAAAGALGAALLALAATPAAASAARVLRVESGGATATISADPWSIVFDQPGGGGLESKADLGFTGATGAMRATRARSLGRDGRSVVSEVATRAGLLRVRVEPAGDGAFVLTSVAPRGALTTQAGFRALRSERFYGFGERSDHVERTGHEVESYVADGPFREEDRNYVKASTPPWAERDRDDATYFPVPWLLSSRGWGVLVDQDETSRFAPAVGDSGRWSAEADGPRLRLVIFSGPTPADALRRFTAATGRQRAPRTPAVFGPWFQTGQANVIPPAEESEITEIQRDAGVPVSVAETQMHHLPCGAHESRRAEERERNRSFHTAGLARLVYFNPSVCLSYGKVFDRAAAEGVLQKTSAGAPFLFPAFVGGSGPLGFTEEPLAQFDWTNPRTEPFYADLVREAIDLGADGWMEDFGESTPTAGIVQHDGTSGVAAHNRYPTDYHCGMRRIASRFDQPLIRFQRSGWTGAARCADVVWGGDPTTVWGFDGLSSAVKQVLSIGLSGVARWGTDIGGYNSFGAGFDQKPGASEDETLTDELLTRWIEFGALVPVMRTKRSGIAIPSYDRPQVFDDAHIEDWRALTELHHQLNPYLRAADETYRRSGLPIARHLVLSEPGSSQARDADDEYLFGPDLLAAPVTAPGLRERSAWVPSGRWVDWWRATRFRDRDGAYELSRSPLLRGGRERSLPAPLGRPPLLIRAGAVLPLLDPDVETLSRYGKRAGIVRLKDRARRLRLLALPRGRSNARLPGGGIARSREGREHWRLSVTARRSTRYDLEASLATLRRPFRPREVLADGRPLPSGRWSFDERLDVLRTSVTGRRVQVDVRPQRRPGAGRRLVSRPGR